MTNGIVREILKKNKNVAGCFIICLNAPKMRMKNAIFAEFSAIFKLLDTGMESMDTPMEKMVFMVLCDFKKT